ncbi:helix-turn-helix transcriptional regulator [Patescibacteria group bacterium]|nr:helix-turn-helix transcriptional regulator [Patescibacteria group bacterium]
MIKQDRYKQIGAKIKDLRESLGISQADLATSAGFSSPTAIALIEAGDRKVSIERLELIAIKLGKDINFFLEGDELEIDLGGALRATKDLSDKDKQLLLNLYNRMKKD